MSCHVHRKRINHEDLKKILFMIFNDEDDDCSNVPAVFFSFKAFYTRTAHIQL